MTSDDNPANDFPAGPKPGERHRTFLDDPVSDHLLRAVVTLSMELSVSRERVKTLETLLVESGALPAGAADAFEPSNEEAVARGAERNALISAILGPIAEDLSKAPS